LAEKSRENPLIIVDEVLCLLKLSVGQALLCFDSLLFIEEICIYYLNEIGSFHAVSGNHKGNRCYEIDVMVASMLFLATTKEIGIIGQPFCVCTLLFIIISDNYNIFVHRI
jgi:hypothetical protein